MTVHEFAQCFVVFKVRKRAALSGLLCRDFTERIVTDRANRVTPKNENKKTLMEQVSIF